MRLQLIPEDANLIRGDESRSESRASGCVLLTSQRMKFHANKNETMGAIELQTHAHSCNLRAIQAAFIYRDGPKPAFHHCEQRHHSAKSTSSAKDRRLPSC